MVAYCNTENDHRERLETRVRSRDKPYEHPSSATVRKRTAGTPMRQPMADNEEDGWRRRKRKEQGDQTMQGKLLNLNDKSINGGKLVKLLLLQQPSYIPL